MRKVRLERQTVELIFEKNCESDLDEVTVAVFLFLLECIAYLMARKIARVGHQQANAPGVVFCEPMLGARLAEELLHYDFQNDDGASEHCEVLVQRHPEKHRHLLRVHVLVQNFHDVANESLRIIDFGVHILAVKNQLVQQQIVAF